MHEIIIFLEILFNRVRRIVYNTDNVLLCHIILSKGIYVFLFGKFLIFQNKIRSIKKKIETYLRVYNKYYQRGCYTHKSSHQQKYNQNHHCSKREDFNRNPATGGIFWWVILKIERLYDRKFRTTCYVIFNRPKFTDSV